MSTRALARAVILGALVATSCASAPQARPRPHGAPLELRKPKRAAPPPEGSHWEPIDVVVQTNVARPDLPLQDTSIVRAGGTEQRWNGATDWARDKLRTAAFAVTPVEGRAGKHGARYVELRERSAAFVITADTLFHLQHVAIDRALADAEDRVLAPALESLLERVYARLGVEQEASSGDLAPAYALARGLAGVAIALAKGTAPKDAAPVVGDEARLVREAKGPAESPLLGVIVDYSRFSPRGVVRRHEKRQGLYRATAWLAAAPLVLTAAVEIEGGTADVARVRTQTRAALLLARVLDPEVDSEAAAAYARWSRLSKFVGGSAEDLSPPDLVDLAKSVGIAMRERDAIANVARVDKLRHAAIDRRTLRVYDGAGGLRARPKSSLAGRAALSVRFFAPRATPDAEVLQGMVFPAVGGAVIGANPPTAFEGRRVLPSALDLAAWLGAPEARLVMHETGDDAYDGFDAALDAMYRRRPEDNDASRHGSIYLSALDAIATYLAPSEADKGQPMAQTSAWRRRKLEVALAAWTALRHDLVPFARAPSAPPRTFLVNKTNAAGVTGFVEPHPEAIAKILGLARQLARGLDALGALPGDGPARPLLREIDEVLTVAFRVSLREANDEPLTSEEGAQLAALPTRIAELEARLGPIADTPLVADVHVDSASGRVLEEGIGFLDDVAMVIREPVSGHMVLAFGAGVTGYERVQPASQRADDLSWRARLEVAPVPRRSFADAYTPPRPPDPLTQR